MRRGIRSAIALLCVVGLAVLAGCGDDDRDEGAGTTEPATGGAMQSGVYFGTVSMTTDRLAFSFEAVGDGARMQAFVADGEPGGDAEWFEGRAADNRFSLTSASGRARMEGTVDSTHVHGSVTLADGRTRDFHTIPATSGAGIYDVTVTADGHFTGTSTTGNRLDARQQGDYVQGTITTTSGEKVEYRNVDVTRVFRYEVSGGQPDRYTMIVSRHGLAQIGRGGAELKRGSPSANVIALDLAQSAQPTPGIYYGKVARTTDQLAMALDAPAPDGSRRVRVYLSDGEPNGDIEWFPGSVTGGRLDLTSASQKAKLTGEITDTAARGTVTLASGASHPFFAVPAGDGAGIYDVEVTPDGRYVGTSDRGGRFELRKDGDAVNGTISTAEGRQVTLSAYDLTKVLGDYRVEGSVPDKYVAFASPGGRYLIGRSGNVRGGTAGNNIIGLDKAC